MARWEPNARGRLEQAALELYIDQGFDETTVGEIAQRAGLTERTFFRHFTDKREVLFGGSAMLRDQLVSGIAVAPATAAPIDVVEFAIESVAAIFQERFPIVRQRQRVIAANPELQERERVKLAALASAVADALRRRGVKEPGASLAAEVGMAAFRVAFQRWVGSVRRQDLSRLIRESFVELKAVTSGG